jgi:DNA mismatch repair ATPase MutL
MELTEVPVILHHRFIKKTPDWFLFDLIKHWEREAYDENFINTTNPWFCISPQWRYAFNNIACKGAVKFGNVLNSQSIEILIANIGKCSDPFHCAHGRRSMHPLIKGLF